MALEVSCNHRKVQPLITENFQGWCETIEDLIIEASDRLPTKTKPDALARHVLATMEGGVMLARAFRTLEPFDQAINHLRDYFDRLLEDRADSEARPAAEGKPKEKSK